MPRAPSRRIGRANRRNRRHIRRSTSAHAQQKQLLTVNKNIAKLNRAVGLTKQYAQYSQNWSGLVGYNILNGPASINAPAWVAKGFNIYELNLPGDPVVPITNGPSAPGWSPIFQATNEVDNANKFYHEKTNLKLSFQFTELVVQTAAPWQVNISVSLHFLRKLPYLWFLSNVQLFSKPNVISSTATATGMETNGMP